MKCIPKQSLEPSQPLLHEQALSTHVPLLLQSISFSHVNGTKMGKKKRCTYYLAKENIRVIMQLIVDNKNHRAEFSAS